MRTKSPIITNGALVIDPITGDLVSDYDIITQVSTTLTGYDGIGVPTLISELHNYLNAIPQNGFQPLVISTAIKNAYQPLISANLISNLDIKINKITANYVNINISCLDNMGNEINLTWTNS